MTIYTPSADAEAMFAVAALRDQGRRVVVEKGEVREPSFGKTLHVAPEYDRDVEADIRDWFEDAYTIRWRNYPVNLSA